MVTKSPTAKLLDTFSQLFNKSGSAGDGDSAEASASPTAGQALADKLSKHKRRDDSVRATELNHLRRIIQEGRAQERRAAPDSGQAFTAPRNSRAGTLERSSILDKIDGAEAHLNQWWGTGSAALAPQNQTHTTPAVRDDDDLELDFTGLLALQEAAPSSGSPDFAPLPPWEDEAPLTALERCLRDAALHYAEGDFETAQSLLADMLVQHATDGEAAEALIFSLLDVYRCSGQQDRFDALALDYARRFGRSPVEWVAVAEPVRSIDAAGLAAQSLDAQRAVQTFWRCPAILDAAALADCAAHHPADSRVFSINWLPLQHMDAALAPAFARQLKLWSASPVELQWVGLQTLMNVLKMCRLGSKASDSAPWWLMQMELCCMAQQAPAFEELAMEYCVALELSPPSWKQVACKLVQADEIPLAADFVATVPTDPAEAYAQTPLLYANFELKGNLTGKHPQALTALSQASRQMQHVTLACTHLGRMDFEAANALRDWLQECKSRGCEVLFTHLPYLVRVYFQTIGMQELASLTTGSRP